MRYSICSRTIVAVMFRIAGSRFGEVLPMLTSTVDRVPAHTNSRMNEKIRRATEENIARYGFAGDGTINHRLIELDREWDVERLLEANAATACLVGLTLGVTVNRKWFLFPAAVAGFLLQHTLQGWCPPLAVFRRIGIRTAAEIDHERYALKAIRGDFDGVGSKSTNGKGNKARAALAASES
jgi:hypothetical protein